MNHYIFTRESGGTLELISAAITYKMKSSDENLMPLEAIARLGAFVDQAIAQAGGQRALARRTGISQGTISKWSAQQIREWPLMGHLRSLARYLGFSFGDFLEYLEEGGESPEGVSVRELLHNIESQESLSYEDAMRLNAAIAKKALDSSKDKKLINH